jgi:Fe-S-cluster containining protein
MQAEIMPGLRPDIVEGSVQDIDDTMAMVPPACHDFVLSPRFSVFPPAVDLHPSPCLHFKCGLHWLCIVPVPSHEVAAVSGYVGCDVELTTPLGPVRGNVHIDSGPMRLAELVPTALELTSIFVARSVQREEQKGKTISCGPGCGVCCRQLVPLSAPEVFYLAEMMQTLPVASQERLQNTFLEIEDRLETLGMVEELLDPKEANDKAFAITRSYFQLKIPCPFLVRESCSIHPNRPVACREYNVTSPPEHCADPYTHEIDKVPMPLPLSAPLSLLTASLTSSRPRLIPMSLMFRWLRDNKDLQHKQWPGPELFEQFMDHVGRKADEAAKDRP